MTLEEPQNENNAAAELRAGIMRASRAGNASGLRIHLTKPCQGAVNKKVLTTALHLSVSGDHLECCEVLLNSGADTDDTNSAGNTCMHVAAAAGHSDVMQLLMDFQASLNIRNHDGKCAIALSRSPEVRQLISAEVERRNDTAKQRAQFNMSLKARADRQQQQQTAPADNRTPPRPVLREQQRQNMQQQQQQNAFLTPEPATTSAPTGAAALSRTPGTDSPSLGSRDLLTCRVCLREFCSEAQAEPMCLPCGHTFCRACISHLRGTSTLGALPHSFRCPLDRQVFSRNLELKVNTLLQDLIPVVRRLSAARIRPSDAVLSPMVAALDVHGLNGTSRTLLQGNQQQQRPRTTRDAACSPGLPFPEAPGGGRGPTGEEPWPRLQPLSDSSAADAAVQTDEAAALGTLSRSQASSFGSLMDLTEDVDAVIEQLLCSSEAGA